MSSAGRRWALALIGAALAPPATAYLTSVIAYTWDERGSAAFWLLPIAIAGIMAGFAALSSAPFRRPLMRLSAQVVYVPSATAVSWATMLLGACSFGDCI